MASCAMVKEGEKRPEGRAMLRIAVMLTSYRTQAWIAKVIGDIQASDFARVELVVIDGIAPDNMRGPWQSRIRPCNEVLFDWYQAWDRRRYWQEPDASALIDTYEGLRDVPVLRMAESRGQADQPIAAEEIERIKDYNLDVLFRFGDTPLDGEILAAARHGVWSFHHGDNSECPGWPALFWEIYKGTPVSGAALQVFTPGAGAGRVIDRGWAATAWRSLYLNRNAVYWKSANYALRRLRDLSLSRNAYFESSRDSGTDRRDALQSPRRQAPGTLQMGTFFARQLRRRISERIAGWTSGQQGQYFVSFRARIPGRSFDDMRGYQEIVSPPDRWYADPFLIEQEGRTFLFFEDFRCAEGRGVISCAELGPEGLVDRPVEVLRRPYHLSYPFCFHHAGQIFMIPESSENRSIELYRAVRFPDEWKLECVLLRDVDASDATIHVSGGKLWMFVALAEGSYSKCDELALYCAENLAGPWVRHPGNPVISDVRRARPAGPVFQDGDRIIRPSQDCSKRYGYALNFSQVLLLNDADYREQPIARIEPDWRPGIDKTHHYSRSSRYEVIDAHRRVRNPVS